MPRICVLITDGKSDACKETEQGATDARKVDKIQVFVVGESLRSCSVKTTHMTAVSKGLAFYWNVMELY